VVIVFLKKLATNFTYSYMQGQLDLIGFGADGSWHQ
jgi:hypothetical protein